MDSYLKGEILGLLNELEEALDACGLIVEDSYVTRERLAFVREEMEYL